jgi:serine phosphatase RsbU (regulator of sigma subunit)/ActR/RegA family two-component response regulator
MNIQILLIEDDDNDALLLQRQLNKTKIVYEFTRVETFTELVHALKYNQYDLVISDYNLLGYTGLDVLKLLKSEKKDIPFLLVSGTIGELAAVSIMKAGACDYVMKDNLLKLPQVVKREIDEHKIRLQNKILETKSIKLSEIISSSGDLILTSDLDLTVNYLNKKAEQLLKMNLNNGPISFRSFLSPIFNQHFFQPILQKIQEKELWIGELILITADGNEIPVLCSFVFHKYGALSNEISIIAKDISFIKEQEKEILKLNQTLEEKVIQRTNELNESLNEITNKNKQILDSIDYAQRIQNSLIPKRSDLNKIFPNSFCFLRPKDIVSGDFFWCHQQENLKYISVIDCTGHGVPGALISIVANQIITKAVIDEKHTETSQILNFINFKVNQKFRSSNTEFNINDGMDMVFCIIDEAKKQITFSGANRPAWIISDEEITEYNGTQKSIGVSDLQNYNQDFDQSIISYRKGDILYLFSDGYYSQFGGERQKKLNKEGFRKLIRSTSSDIFQQEEKLNTLFSNWKGKLEQVDDVCVVGIQL